MNLAELRRRLKDGRAKLVDLKTVLGTPEAKPEDKAAYKSQLELCEGLVSDIELAIREEALEGKSTKSANAGLGEGEEGDHETGHRTFAEPEVKLTQDQRIAMCAAAGAKSALLGKYHGVNKSPLAVLQDDGFPRFAKTLENAQRASQKAGVMSTESSGVLLPAPVAGDIIPFLRPETTFLQGNPRRVRLIGGKYRQPRGASAATAGYVGEGQKKPVGKPSFDDISLQAKKLAGIVYLTMEAAKWPVADIEAYIRDDLRAVLALTMDAAAYFGTGSSNAPLGILRKTGISTFDASTQGFVDPKNPTPPELDRVAHKMILALVGSNILRSNRWGWRMGFRAAGYIADLRDGNGNATYPTMNVENGGVATWKGIPVAMSSQFTENGGTNTDEGTIALIDFGYVIFGDEQDLVMRSSTEATIDDGGTLVHLFQQNQMAILAEMEHDWALTQPKAVAVLTKVRWGAA